MSDVIWSLQMHTLFLKKIHAASPGVKYHLLLSDDLRLFLCAMFPLALRRTSPSQLLLPKFYKEALTLVSRIDFLPDPQTQKSVLKGKVRGQMMSTQESEQE